MKYKTKAIKSFLLLMSIMLVITGCGLLELGSKNKSTKEPLKDYPELSERVKGTLEERYNQKFEIDRIAFLNQIDVFVLYCNPVDDKELEFRVKTGGKYGESLWDEYGKLKTDHEIGKYYKPIIKEKLPYKLVSNPNFITYTDWGRIPSAKELLEDESQKTKIYLNIYIFEDVIENDKEEFLNGVLELIRILEKQDLKESKVIIEIYNEDFFKGIDPEWLMEETDWLSHNIFEVPDRYKDIIKTRDSHEYRQNLQDGFHIESENYKQINNIKDIEDRVWLND
jgi:predicted small lipoprotein YifL